MSRYKAQGFTLVELMVTIAVVAILAAVAFPSFRSTMRSNQMATSTNELLAAISLARSEAIRNNGGGGVCASRAGATCDGSWNDGVMAYGDADGSGTFSDGDTVLRFSQGRRTLQINTAVSPTSGIAFDRSGRRRAAADQVMTLTPDSCRAGDPRRTLTVNLSGQVRVVRDTCQ